MTNGPATMTSLRYVYVASIFVLMIAKAPSACAGALPTYSSKFPALGSITIYESSVWFAGEWNGRLLVVQYDSSGHWSTFASPLPSNRCDDIQEHGAGIFFVGKDYSTRFDRHSRTWSLQDTGLQSLKSVATPSDKDYEVFPGGIAIGAGSDLKRYQFPYPSFNAYRRWRSDPRPDDDMGGAIASHAQVGDNVWFTIGFYAGEGSTGIGGLGLFDLDSREYGVLRHRWLAGSSLNRFLCDEDRVFVGTGIFGELETSGYLGLVIVDLHRGMIANLNQSNSPLVGTMFNEMAVINGRLWMLTDRAIVGWEMQSNTWCAARMDSVIIGDSTLLYRRIHNLANKGDWGSFACDSIIPVVITSRNITVPLNWTEHQFARLHAGAFTLAEVGLDSLLDGWVSKTEFDMLQKADTDFIASGPGVVVYQDKELMVPFDHVMFAGLKPIRTRDNAVLVKVRAFWCKASDVTPRFSELFHDRICAPAWERLSTDGSTNRDLAIREFKKEQAEIRDSIPVYDTTLTLHKGMNLFEQFGEMIDVRWLPGDRGEEASPTGIEIRFEPPDGEIDVNVSCSHGKLLVNGAAYQPNSEWTARSSTMKTALVFTDLRAGGEGASVLESVTLRYRLWLFPSTAEDARGSDGH